MSLKDRELRVSALKCTSNKIYTTESHSMTLPTQNYVPMIKIGMKIAQFSLKTTEKTDRKYGFMYSKGYTFVFVKTKLFEGDTTTDLQCSTN